MDNILKIRINETKNDDFKDYIYDSESKEKPHNNLKYFGLNVCLLIFAIISLIASCLSISYAGFAIKYLVGIISKVAVVMLVISTCVTVNEIRKISIK